MNIKDRLPLYEDKYDVINKNIYGTAPIFYAEAREWTSQENYIFYDMSGPSIALGSRTQSQLSITMRAINELKRIIYDEATK